ncbi:hypothetical protein HG558_04665 [Helicobacter pylori]|uniref:DUF3226 domain-containing protein n=1 Tax=Helicobacter pylori TaxID=210 RepID=UPI001923E019|nr:DUF3226 domain-containing protein [Helicobacter pylori]QQW96735.1 hypothetical protein HG558_04665 [Helicobacter pylori]
MSKKILIYTEGKSDRNFLGWYLIFLKCEDHFDIFDIEGKDKLISDEFLKKIDKILNNEHPTYKQVCIIFDADKKESQESDAGFDNKLKYIREKFKEKGINFPREQIFLFPNNQGDGDLETLLLEIAKYDKLIKCFEKYLKCIECKCIGIKEHYKPIKKIRKNMLYAYLEALGLEDLYTKKNIFDIEGKVKNEYKEDCERLKKAIKFESDILVPLKNFLGQFAENNQK